MPDTQENNIKILHKLFMVAFGTNSVLVQHVNNPKLCAYCNLDVTVEDGVMFYDKNWYHNECWNSFENQNRMNKDD